MTRQPAYKARFEPLRALSACVALILLAIQVFGAALTPPAAAAFDSDRIEICTVSGLMVLGHDGQPEQAPPADHGGHCLFCLPLLHAGAPPAAPGLFVAYRPVERLDFKAPSTRFAVASIPPLAGAASPQAPPVSV